MPEHTGTRLARIAEKLAAVADSDRPLSLPEEEHGYRLGACLPEEEVAAFEAAHGVDLPEEYRRFLIEVGDGGAGPSYGLAPLADACSPGRCGTGHLARPSAYRPGVRYRQYWDGWDFYDMARAGHDFVADGTLTVVNHGCTLTTQLIVSGPSRGRLFNVDTDGIGPYVLEDEDFLAWYERWLDELTAGYRLDWFGEYLPGDEPVLVTILTEDPSPDRRTRAARSLIKLPYACDATNRIVLSEAAVEAFVQALRADPDPMVRREILRFGRDHGVLELAEAARDVLSAPEPAVRNAAIRTLTALGHADLVGLATSLLSDPVAEVRRAAVEALGQSGGADLRPMLADESHLVHGPSLQTVTASDALMLADQPDDGVCHAAADTARPRTGEPTPEPFTRWPADPWVVVP
ncbi:HEAT repeat domain-containing protein [Catellatospora sichuanensis]|uniref:HEAT repeat domain-containing protein n=1 Tax=Catellatospora sichuanensis TaxID=1969805 RepID=UPI0011821B9C|nr:HEAT repeat domain-containing protein [Catellatospora sichuanensis]